MKNILYRDQSVDFVSQYVNITFSLSDKKIADQRALFRIRRGARFLICGTAGAGKTMFMRWSALELINTIKTHGRVPLYLEMRYFEEAFENEPLKVYLYKKTSSLDDTSSFSQFVKGLESGMFIVLLDTIDEIKPSLREKVVNKILDFLREYPLCGVAISSRFDEKLESIQEFSVLRTIPMSRDQIVAVIEKLEYDLAVKLKLIERLKGGLYKELKEFLSNPLLATIMLLTFDHSADIPTKLTAFYQQAFEALYQRHDAAKGGHTSAIIMLVFRSIASKRYSPHSAFKHILVTSSSFQTEIYSKPLGEHVSTARKQSMFNCSYETLWSQFALSRKTASITCSHIGRFRSSSVRSLFQNIAKQTSGI
jgi:hypothetical protein